MNAQSHIHPAQLTACKLADQETSEQVAREAQESGERACWHCGTLPAVACCEYGRAV